MGLKTFFTTIGKSFADLGKSIYGYRVIWALYIMVLIGTLLNSVLIIIAGVYIAIVMQNMRDKKIKNGKE